MGKRTGRIAVLGSLVTAAALCLSSSAAQAAKLNVSSATGDPGTQVTFTVTLASEGASVAGTQNDIAFDAANTPVAAKATNSKPDCSVNPDIDKGATSFAFRPNGCTGAACTSIRALVLSTDNVAAIADGSVLYTCKVNIAASASGSFPLTITGIILSDPAGQQIAGPTGTNGSVSTGGVQPTATGGVVQPTATPPPAACNPPAVQVVSKSVGAAGASTFDVKLLAGTAMVAGTQNDIAFDQAKVAIAAKATNSKPDCSVNPDIDKGATSFAFRPNGCSGAACTSIRALVLSTDNVAAIPDGSVLYTCKVNVTSSGDLTVTGTILSDPAGQQVAGASGCSGTISVGGPPPATNTPGGGVTNTPAPTKTATPVIAPATNTPVPATATKAPATATRAPTAKPTASGGGQEDEGGCNIGANGNGGSGWLLLIPAVGLLVLRRRTR